MKENNNREFETRGKILALSLQIEELLNRIIYNFFLPKSSDQETRNKFLELFVFNTTFGRKKQIYDEILKMSRYQKKVEEQLKTFQFEIDSKVVDNYAIFKTLTSRNLQEIIKTRNDIAHGFDITKAFLALKEDEMVFANKFQMIKFDEKSTQEYFNLVANTSKLLEITKGKLQEQ